jgi:uncharacterized protein involved in exopolysaccharide biosynthesis
MGTPRAADDEISLWEVLAVLLRQRRWIVRSIVACAALAVVLAFVRARTWTTSASFRPQGSQGASELMALASQFGVNVGGSDEGESPALYQELLGSREILSRVAVAEYSAADVSGTLPVLLEIEADTPELELSRAVEWLEEQAVSVSTGRETGTVTLSVTTEWPGVSEAIARHLLDEVSRFNLETRQSQAGAERTFIEERVTAAEESLREAEAALQTFLQNNRVVGEFSQAKLEFDRLQREVLNRQQVYTTLVQSYEQARISEVRDTPVITVLQQPFLPPEPDGRGLVLGFALGVVLGGMLGVVLAFLAEVFGRPAQAGDPARRDFDEEWAGFLGSLPFRRSS